MKSALPRLQLLAPSVSPLLTLCLISRRAQSNVLQASLSSLLKCASPVHIQTVRSVLLRSVWPASKATSSRMGPAIQLAPLASTVTSLMECASPVRLAVSLASAPPAKSASLVSPLTSTTRDTSLALPTVRWPPSSTPSPSLVKVSPISQQIAILIVLSASALLLTSAKPVLQVVRFEWTPVPAVKTLLAWWPIPLTVEHALRFVAMALISASTSAKMEIYSTWTDATRPVSSNLTSSAPACLPLGHSTARVSSLRRWSLLRSQRRWISSSSSLSLLSPLIRLPLQILSLRSTLPRAPALSPSLLWSASYKLCRSLPCSSLSSSGLLSLEESNSLSLSRLPTKSEIWITTPL